MVLEYDGKIPTVDETAFIHDMAFVSGEVYIGKDVFILPFASIRGDMNAIYIGEGSNIQDNAVVHVTDTLPTSSWLQCGAQIEDNVLVAAGTLIPPRKRIPSGSLVVGNPYKIVRTLSEEEIQGIKENALDYIKLKDKYMTAFAE